MDAVLENPMVVVRAFGYTLLLFALSSIGSLLLGVLLAAMRVGPVAVMRRAGATYVFIFRNTPLLVVFLFFRFAGPKIGIQFNFVNVEIAGLNLNNIFTAGVVSLTLYTAAFVCEAMRSGINAVDLGQSEAARAVGLTFGGVMTQVVLPQALRAAVPPMASVQIALLKNTTVAGTFGVFEAFARMRALINDDATARLPLFFLFSLIFVALVLVLSYFANRLERRWKVA
jgi:glutamate transport system permease protein